MAVLRSPAGTATNARQNSAQARAGGWPDRRAASMAASSSSAASARRPSHAPGDAERRVDPGEQLALPGCAADRERALGVRGGLDEAVEVDLRAGELHGGVEAPGELLVGQRVDDRGRLGAHLLASGRLAAPGQRASERGQRGGLERRIADGLGGVDGLLRPRPGRPGSAVGRPRRPRVRASATPRPRRRRRAGLRARRRAAHEPARGGRAGARPARRRRPAARAARSPSASTSPRLSSERLVGFGEAAGRRQRRGAGGEQLDALIGGQRSPAAGAARRRTIAPPSPARAGRTAGRPRRARPRRPCRRPWPRRRRAGREPARRRHGRRGPGRRARARRCARRPARPRRRRAGRSDGGSESAGARWSAGSGRR